MYIYVSGDLCHWGKNYSHKDLNFGENFNIEETLH